VFLSLCAPMPLRTLFLDLNAYFASVEQHVNPALRGRPIGVSPILAPSGCCIAVSYEAKKFGVKTGTTVAEAQRLCPEITIVPARPRLYVLMHHRVLRAIDTVIPVHKVHSIDEVSCRLDQRERAGGPEAARELALRVKAALRERCGPLMRCSIGIGPNRVLAKLGTDLMKPDGLIIFADEDLPEAIEHLSPQELSGIGPRMMLRLERAGIATIADLLKKTEKEMRGLWGGLIGERWYHILRGEEVFDPPTHKSSIGHQHVLAPELRTMEQGRSVAQRLLLKAAARLRHEKYAARKLTLGLSFMGGERIATPGPPSGGWGSTSWGEWISLDGSGHGGCDDSPTILAALGTLWDRAAATNQSGGAHARPVLVSVTLTDLVPPGSITLPLFGHEASGQRLSKAMDLINQRFGANKLYTANMQDVRDSGTGGIAFNYVPDLALADSVQSRQRGGTHEVSELDPDAALLTDAQMEALLEAGIVAHHADG
jgi:DNA polymerase IV